ncbi:hypothetical protein POX_h09741 [Penicillium oxalicum]|uniref:EthD domain-containing protein n=1 Tax=Penicillium oxalicum (strain 114-2 / CGMCC 5302) TaxID=933388 RepID=S7ZRY5_PENO1|nr:hypothetical protein POX_h09741 [Penicillium oxalicum]EPS31456.1 hypothetical protein PDE_06411 [Penicillium oxalicum 114-2]KAI2785976.1 hypothetical protein POX_h09741 [Penicillium oxalicum]
MTYKVLVYAHRLPGVSPELFKQRYEAHIDLFKRLVGDAFPLSHRRVYIARTRTDTTPQDASPVCHNANTPATVIVGQQSDYDYDCLAEMTFADQTSWEACVERVRAPEISAQIAADEDGFFDRSKTGVVVVGDVFETRK